MKTNKTIYDNPIVYIIMIIIVIGITMLYSASSTIAYNKFNEYAFFLNKHIIRLIIGLSAFIVMYNLDFKLLKKYSKSILVLSWFILLSAYFFSDGSSTNRFLIIAGQNLFTTSDFAKISLIIFTANFIESNKKDINDIQVIIKNFIPYVAISLLLILFQPDLSTTIAISLIILTMLLIAGLKIKYIAICGIISSTGIIYKIFTTPYQFKRLFEWLHGKGNWQLENSLQALGNGGLIGTGFGNSIIKDGFMPEVHTDFILPIIGEEFGFIGVLIIFILFLGIYYYGIRICKTSPDIFSSMLALGITINILYYFLINATYVVGLLPTTGLPIPFISYGGSHTLFSLISIGILVNISQYTNIYKYKTYE